MKELSRRSFLIMAASSPAILLACGERADPANFTIQTSATENRRQAIDKMFENSAATPIVLKKPQEPFDSTTQEDIWKNNNGEYRNNLLPNSGTLQILLPETFNQDSNPEPKAAVFTSDGKELTVGKVKFIKAGDSLSSHQLPKDLAENLVVEIFLTNVTQSVGSNGLTVYLENKTTNDQQQTVNRSRLNISPQLASK